MFRRRFPLPSSGSRMSVSPPADDADCADGAPRAAHAPA
jgi:hypothetical protein